jgi:hypothetical protein
MSNRLFEEEDALETAAHQQAATLLRHTQMMKNPAYSTDGYASAPAGLLHSVSRSYCTAFGIDIPQLMYSCKFSSLLLIRREMLARAAEYSVAHINRYTLVLPTPLSSPLTQLVPLMWLPSAPMLLHDGEYLSKQVLAFLHSNKITSPCCNFYPLLFLAGWNPLTGATWGCRTTTWTC